MAGLRESCDILRMLLYLKPSSLSRNTALNAFTCINFFQDILSTLESSIRGAAILSGKFDLSLCCSLRTFEEIVCSHIADP